MWVFGRAVFWYELAPEMTRAMDDLDFPGWQPAKSVEVVEGNGLTQVLVKGQPYMRWQSGDEGCTRLAIVQLYKCGLGTEEDLLLSHKIMQ